jgi:1,4-alpha-glucan branching enzyme
MGWMHDTLEYMHTDPLYRRYHHHKMTFGLLYAFSENFILPLSHDEVTHGKGSLINKMPGDEWQRFANLRAYYGFMWTHPGKKLLFMGSDFAQVSEWHDWTSLEWHVLQYPLHRGVKRLVQDLNTLYRHSPALYRCDTEPESFRWIEANDTDNSVYSFLRLGMEQDPVMLVVSHFTPVPHTGYRIGVPGPGVYREVFNSDAAIYGGSNMGNAGAVDAEPIPSHGFPYSVLLTIPPLATIIFEHHHG